MIKKWILFLVIILTIISILAYIFRPIPFDKEFDYWGNSKAKKMITELKGLLEN